MRRSAPAASRWKWSGTITSPASKTVISTHVEPLLRRHDAVTVRWFDAEAWSAAPSDVLLADTDDITAWSDLFEEKPSTAPLTVRSSGTGSPSVRGLTSSGVPPW
jgi:hypothetical protein